MQSFILWTDGASGGRKDCPGGWAFVLIHTESGLEVRASGFDPCTTNNRMELQAVLEGVKAIGAPENPGLAHHASITIFTDSGYVKNGFLSYLSGWKKNGWVSSRGDAVANRDLWEQLDAALHGHFVRWRLVKGHVSPAAATYGGLHYNRECDRMAVAAKHAQAGSLELR